VTKEDGKYFLVTLEPFSDKKTRDFVLKKIKETKYKDAYILKLQNDTQLDKKLLDETKQITKKEIPIEEVKIEEVKPVEVIKPKSDVPKVVVKTVQTPKPVTQAPKPLKIEQPKENFVQTYMMEIIAAIAILIIIVIYIFMLKNKHKKSSEDEFIDLQDEYVNSIEEDMLESAEPVDEYEYSDEAEALVVPDASNIDISEESLEETPEIIEPVEQVEDASIDKLKSNVQKKEVPAHTKISKDDFKEFEGLRVMIAEDNLINQKVIKGLLSESGINLTIVDDGEEVLRHLEEDDAFCLILMDVHMPNMDGFEATRIIRSNPKYSHITVVALSGDVAADDIANMRAVGMQENLEKPLKMDDLYDILYAYGYHREDKIDIENDNTEEASCGLDTEAGIEVCGGDKEFYKEILRDFLNNYEGSSKKIQDYLNNNDKESAQKILLDIAGVTANIGASNLQEIIKILKLELLDPDSKEYIETFKKYATHFDALEKEVREYLS
jgi:CheY-like chemotaxis protein